MTTNCIRFSHSDEDLSISFESQAVTTDEVMSHFIQFLSAMGYARESIHEAMQEIVDEHDDYLKNLDKEKSRLPFDVD
jgi:DNA-binding transcriptional regulator YhcF (GntR family)